MKLYLSSYDFGNNPAKLRDLFGDSVEVALISSALDFSTDIERLKESEKKRTGWSEENWSKSNRFGFERLLWQTIGAKKGARKI